MNPLFDQEIGNPFQDLRIGDAFTRIIEARCIDHYHSTTTGGIPEAVALDFKSLRFEAVTDYDARILCDELDELQVDPVFWKSVSGGLTECCSHRRFSRPRATQHTVTFDKQLSDASATVKGQLLTRSQHHLEGGTLWQKSRLLSTCLSLSIQDCYLILCEI